MIRHLRVLVLACSATAAAQAVWTVAPGANLNQIFAAATAGDIVLLSAGSYQPFTLTKGLTVIGPAVIEALQYPAVPITGPWDTFVNIPAGQQARFVGLDFRTTPQPLLSGSISGHSVGVTGSVSMEDCLVGPGYVNFTSGILLLQRCTISRDWRMGGLRMSGGVCSLSDCTLLGRFAYGNGYGTTPSEAGLIVTGGKLVGSRLTIWGGNGVPPMGYVTYHTPPSPGVHCTGGTTQVTLTDSSVFGGGWGGPGPGAAGIVSSTVLAVRIARTSAQGGTGASTGPALSGNVLQASDLVGMHMDHGFLLGQTTTATATAGSSQQILVMVGGFDATPSIHPLVSGPIFGVPAGLAVLTSAVPAAGAPVNFAIAVPNVPALLTTALWLQTFQFDGVGQWLASPLVGGNVH